MIGVRFARRFQAEPNRLERGGFEYLNPDSYRRSASSSVPPVASIFASKLALGELLARVRAV